MPRPFSDDIEKIRKDLEAKTEQIEKLEGWLKLLYYHHCDDRETDKILQELFEYIKAAEGQ